VFDAHVHLDFLSAAAVAEYVRRARGAGVAGFAIPGISMAQWPIAARLAASINGAAVWGCGVHPEHASQDPSEVAALIRCAKEQRPDFIGETGLDARLEVEFSRRRQEELFVAHIDLAESLELPLVVHSVRRHPRVLELLEGRSVSGMIHGFIGSTETAADFFSRGWMLSAGRSAMRSPKTRRALVSAPLDRILLESDEPREVSDVPEVVDWLSDARGVSRQIIAAQTHKNALQLFGG
jgi:TatD DNase family protein